MFRTAPTVAARTAEELRNLPPQHLVFSLDTGWMVVGPTGVFVLVAEGKSRAKSASAAVTAAETLRERLADFLMWVPFVDAILVTNQAPDVGPSDQLACSAVPIDLLRTTITDGPTHIDEETLGRLALFSLRKFR